MRQIGWKGGMLFKVPPRHTSQACSVCGHVSPTNRPSQAVFRCRACGHTEHADINAAKNIRARGHRVLACGRRVQSGPPMKRNPWETVREYYPSPHPGRMESRPCRRGGCQAFPLTLAAAVFANSRRKSMTETVSESQFLPNCCIMIAFT